MVQNRVKSRNEALEFARRTRQNLYFIENAAAQDPSKVPVVTQLTLSLVGLVVFPKEKLLLDHTEKKTIAGRKRGQKFFPK